LCKGRGTTEGGGGIVSEPKNQFFLAKFFLLLYNDFRQDFLTVFTPAVMSTFTYKLCAEFMKGGMLMKSKHIATYGKKIALCNFRNYHTSDNFFHKSTIAALCQGRLL